jgi:hypothetical protein
MADGEKSGTWGTITNTNLGTLLEQAVTGVASVTHDNSASYTLTTNNGSTDEARNAVVLMTGTLTAAREVIVPDVDKVYIFKNGTSGGYDLTFKTSGGSGVTIPNGRAAIVYVDASTGAVNAIDDGYFTDSIFIEGTGTGNFITAESTNAGSASGPDMKMYRNSASPADGDAISKIVFHANTDDGAGGVSVADVEYANIAVTAPETNETTGEAGKLTISLKRGGTTQSYIEIQGGTNSDSDDDSITFKTGGSAVITIDNSQNVTIANDLTVDTNTLHVDSANNRVGIGTSSPTVPLHLKTVGGINPILNIEGTAFTPGIRMYSGGTAITPSIRYGTGAGGTALKIEQINTGAGIDGAATERMRIDSSGNVGIGTTSPSSYGKLVSLGGDNATLFAAVGSTNMLRVQGYNSTYLGTVLEAVNLAQSANTPMFVNASEVKFGINGTERMLIDNSGNVGIGTSSPTHLLHLYSADARSPTILLENNSAGDSDVGIIFAENSENYAYRIGTDDSGNTFRITYKSGGIDPAPGTDDDRLVIDTSGNVGIGTSSPSGKLQVETSGTAANLYVNSDISTSALASRISLGNSTSAARFTFGLLGGGGEIAYLGSEGSFPLYFQTAGTERMRISSGGDVAIGVSSPNEKLTVSGNIELYNDEQDGYIWFHDAGTRSWTIGSQQSTGSFVLTNEVDIASGEKFVVDSSGSVGIGTSSPIAQSKLTVAGGSGSISVTGSDGNFSAGGQRTFMDFAVGKARIGGTGGGGSGTSLGLYVGTGLEAIAVGTTGQVGIGPSGYSTNRIRVSSDNPTSYTSAQLEVFSSAGNVLQSFHAGGATAVIWKHPRSSNVLEARNNSDTGYININAAAFTVSSDYRLKENVTDITDATERLKRLNPVRFNFKPFEETGEEHHSDIVDGFLAHEVSHDSDGNPLVPEAITGTKDAMRDEQYVVTPAVLDDDGNEVTPAVMGTRSVPDYQKIDQSKLVPLLVKTIQELEARITALEAN